MVKLKKDKSIGVRINSEVLEKLKSKGWTVQKIFDFALSEIVGIDVSEKIKIKLKTKA